MVRKNRAKQLYARKVRAEKRCARAIFISRCLRTPLSSSLSLDSPPKTRGEREAKNFSPLLLTPLK